MPVACTRVTERAKMETNMQKNRKQFENDIIGNLEIDLIHFCSVFYFKVPILSPQPSFP